MGIFGRLAIGSVMVMVIIAPLPSAWAGGETGWHRPGTAEEGSSSDEGPSLIAPQSSTAKRSQFNSRTAQANINAEVIQPLDDNWAEQALANRPRVGTGSGGRRAIVRASHSSQPMMRQLPPSAFSEALPPPPPTIRSTPPAVPSRSSPAPEPPEELPTPEQMVSPNTDILLMNPPVDDFQIDQVPLGAVGPACNTCGQGCKSGAFWGYGNYLENLTIFAGPQAFKGPPDNGRNGDFGLHEGINWGSSFWFAQRIGYQVGAQVVQSNFSGNNVVLPSSASRTQYFLTAGLFKRAIAGDPWQWGVAFDGLNDNYYVNMRLAKIRAEFSFVGASGDEIGFWTSIGLDSSHSTNVVNSQVVPVTWRSTDLYALFFRRYFGNGGNGRLWAGLSDDGNGMLGGDFRVPMSRYLAFEGNANYLIPNHGGGSQLNQESWATMFNLVWYIGGGALSASSSPWRPLFNVADNSIFMIKTK